MPKKKTRETQAEQSKGFIEKARDLGADTDKDTDEVMRRLARQKRHDAAASKAARRKG